MDVRSEVKSLIENLIEEIGRDGEIMVIHGGSEEKPTTLKHDRTVSLKNYVMMWDKLKEIYPDTQEKINLKQVRENL